MMGLGLPSGGRLVRILERRKRTWDQKVSCGLLGGQLDLGITGLMLLMFMTIHFFQFRFADTGNYYLSSPPTLINWWPSWLITLTLFWTDDKHVLVVPVRDRRHLLISATRDRVLLFTLLETTSCPHCFPCQCSRGVDEGLLSERRVKCGPRIRVDMGLLVAHGSCT